MQYNIADFALKNEKISNQSKISKKEIPLYAALSSVEVLGSALG